jgi:hypothetical protein
VLSGYEGTRRQTTQFAPLTPLIFREWIQYLSCQPDLDGGQSAYMLSILRHSNVPRRNSF